MAYGAREQEGPATLADLQALPTRATLPKDVRFYDTRFPGGTVVEHAYAFNGYRGSYLYRLMDRERLQWDVGVSPQIRTALVELRSLDCLLLAREADLGPVPALKTRLTWRFYGGGVDNPDGDPPLYNFANPGFALAGVRADLVELRD